VAKRRNRNKRNNPPKVALVPTGTNATALALPSSLTTEQNPPQSNVPLPQIKGGRQTQPTNLNPLGNLSYSFIPRRQYAGIDISDLTLYGGDPFQLIDMLIDVSPEVSLALWNTVRLVNTNFTYKVMLPSGTRELAKGKAVLDALLERINADYGGMRALITSWCISLFSKGACAGEIALTDDLSDIDDIYAVQPNTIHFERDFYTQKLVPFQQQVMSTTGNQGWGYGAFPYRRLNPATFGYIPFDAPADDPYGRSPMASALQVVIFDLQVMKDLRQSIHANAWGRLDIKLLEEALLKNAPQGIQRDPTGEKARKFIADQLAAFQTDYAQIKPDDAFIHLDSVEVSSVDSSGKIFNADALVRIIERRFFRALKQLPTFMGSNEGTTETHSTVQLVITVNSIQSYQGSIANLIEKLFDVALQIYGINGRAKVEFDTVRATDRLMDANADLAEIQVAAQKRDQGWITQDDASISVTGSKAVGEPKPVAAPQQFANQPDATQGKDSTKAKPADNGNQDDPSNADNNSENQPK
jgi:tmRNA-binding protein